MKTYKVGDKVGNECLCSNGVWADECCKKAISKRGTFMNAEGFYNASGSDTVASVAAKYNVSMSAIAVRYGVPVNQIQSATLDYVASKANTTVSNVEAQIKSMGNSSQTDNKAGNLFSSAFNFFSNAVNSQNQPPPPSYTPVPESSTGFKVFGVNGYVVIGGGVVALVGLIYLGTKLLKK
jgi:hypothetical protein